MGEIPGWRESESPVASEIIKFTARHGSLLASLLVVIGVVFPPAAAAGAGVQLAADTAGEVDTALRPLEVFAKKATKAYGKKFAQCAPQLSEFDRSAAEVRAAEIIRGLPRRETYVAALLGSKEFGRLALADEAKATSGMSAAGVAYFRALVRQTGVLIAKYLRGPEAFGIVGSEALRDLNDALADVRTRQDAQDRSIGGLAGRVELLEGVARELEDELARRARMTVVAGPDAWGIASGWDPLGPDVLPVTQECGVRLDVLWARDRSPFRAVLADAVGAPLIDLLDRGMSSMPAPTQRKWLSLSTDGEALPASRDQLLLDLGLDCSSPGPVGIVTTLHSSAAADLRAVAQSGASVLGALARLLPFEPIVLRVEDDSSERSIRLAALVGRFARASIPAVEVLTRVRTTDGALPLPGGSLRNAVALIGDTVRSRRQALGAEAPWPPFSDDPSPDVGADTAAAVPSELCRTTSPLPGRVPEDVFLRHVRDSCAGIWQFLVRAYARSEDPARWRAGLSAASDWTEDLECWITTCDLIPGSLLRHPDRFHSHDVEVIDRLILALRGTHGELVDPWLPFASPALRATLHPKPLTEQRPSLARILATRAPDLLIDPNREVFLLSRDAAVPINALEAAGVSPEAVLSLAASPAQDPDLRHRTSYFRRIVRPYLEET